MNTWKSLLNPKPLMNTILDWADMNFDKFEIVESIIALQAAIMRIQDDSSTRIQKEWITVIENLIAKFEVEYERIRNENI